MTIARLRPSIHVAPVDSGVAFLGLDDSFVLSGNSDAIWAVWRAVAPMLEQGVVLADLLDAARTPSVRGLLETLIEQFTAHDMLISPPAGFQDQKHPEEEKFAEVFGFLEAVAPDPARSFAALRAASVSVEGPADLVFAATRTLARSAIGQINAVVTDGEPLDLARLARYVPLDGINLAVLPGHRPDALITTPGSPNRPADPNPRRFEVQVLPDFAAIAAVASPGSTSGVEPGSTAGASPGSTAGVEPGPTAGASPGSTAGVEPAWADRLKPEEPGQALSPSPSPSPSPVLVTLAASTAAHQAVLWLAGLPAQADGRQVIGIDAADLATTTHQLPLPPATRDVAASESRYLLPPDTGSLLPGTNGLASRAHILPPGTDTDLDPATPDELLAAADALTDNRFGLLPPPHPRALIQVPLALAISGAGEDGQGVLGVAETGEYARLDALLAAVRRCPGSLPDPAAKARCVGTGQMVAADLTLHWVIAAGHELRQLLADALARLLVAQAEATGRFESIELAPAADRQSWRWLKTMTVRWGHQVRLVRWTSPDLPGWVVIGARATTGRERPLAGWAAGPDEAGCVQAALVRLCGAAQARRDPAAPPLPDPIAPASVTWPDLKAAVATLDAAGQRLVLVPWTAQPAIADAGLLLAHAGISHDRP